MLTVERENSAAQSQVACPECGMLTHARDLTRRNYAMAVDELFATGYRFNDKTYAALKNSVEETRAQWEIAQSQLDRHKRSSH